MFLLMQPKDLLASSKILLLHLFPSHLNVRLPLNFVPNGHMFALSPTKILFEFLISPCAQDVKFQILTAVMIRIHVLWDRTLCWLINSEILDRLATPFSGSE